MTAAKTTQADRAAKLQEALSIVKENYLSSAETFLFGNEAQRGLVLTLDEHDMEHPVKPLPDRPHLRELTRMWPDTQQLIIAKSRQLMISWWVASMIVWEVWHPGRQWATTCRKFDDADALMERKWHIIKQIPKDLWPAKIERKQGLIRVHHESAPSQVLALSQDSDAPRSRTFSGIWVDEAAFTDNLEKLHTSAKPTTMAGGKFILTSSPNGRGYFYQLLSDGYRLDL